MKSVESIVEEHAAQERRYQLLQAAATILAGRIVAQACLDLEESVDAAEVLLEEIERRDKERRQA